MANEQDPKEGNNESTNKEKKEDNNTDSGKVDNFQLEKGGAGDVVEDFIEDIWQVMTPEMLERLRCVLTEDIGMSKKDADKFIQSQREIRKQRICLKKDNKSVRIGPRNQWIKELSKDIANQMASFLVGLLLSNRTPRAKRLTEKILERLCKLIGEKTTIKTAKTRIQRTLVVIADRMATYFDEAITDYEKEIIEAHGYAPPLEDWKSESMATLTSSETCTLSEEDECDLDQMSESELERLLSHDRKKKVSIQEKDEIVSDEEEAVSDEEEVVSDEEEVVSDEEEVLSDEEEVVSDEEEVVSDEEDSETKEESEEDNITEEESEEAEEEEEEEVIDEFSKVEREEDVGEEEVNVEEEESEGVDQQEEDEGEDEEEKEDKGIEETEEKSPIKHLDPFELMKEDIERTPKGDSKTDRQMVVKDIIEKRFEEIAKDKLNKSVDSIVKFDIDETASIVANWLEKILPSEDIIEKLSLVPTPSLIPKQGSAFKITEGEGSAFEVRKLSSTTVAQKVAETKGVDFPIRKKKLPRSMSPLNTNTTKDWADWALEAANVGEEWGKWLDKALHDVEEHLLKDKDIDSSQLKRNDDWKNWKDSMEDEAQKWRAEKHKIKGEAYLWNKKIESGKPVGQEKVVNY